MFTHLHYHSGFSILDGYGTPEDIIKRAKELRFEAIAITDHASVDGLIKFQRVAKKEEIQLICGCEMYIVPNIYNKKAGEKRKHITLWVKNHQGWENLLKMLTIANTEGFYYRPRIDPNTLLKHVQGLAIGTACASTFVDSEWGVELLNNLLQKTEVFGEVMPFDEEGQKRINNIILDYAEQFNFPIIATNDAHYIQEEDSIVQETMLAIQSKKDWNDPTRWKFNVTGLYMKTMQEMVEAFKIQGVLNRRQIQTALKNTALVKELCKDFHIEQVDVELPRVPQVVDSGLTDRQYLQKLIEHGFNNIVTKEHDLYQDRVDEELKLIYEKKFEKYFLIVWEIVQWCNNNDIMVGPGRGSAGGSLICYLLGITQVDPIKYNLLFSRFLAPSRTDYPDIDIDYERKDLVREHLEEVYGKWSVAGVSTFMYMKGKSAIRDVCRTFKIDYKFTNAVAGAIEDDKVTSLENSDVGQEFIRQYPQQYEIAKKLDGQIRGRGQHACAVVITEKDLRNGERVALVSNKQNGDLITNFDKDDIEFCGFLKLDVLGLSELVVLKEAKKLIKKNHNIDIDYSKVDLEDKKLYEQFSLGNTIGCFQVGTYGLSEFCSKLGIDDFMMLSHATSLYRPGPLRSGMSDQFIQRKNGIDRWSFIHDSLKDIVGFTYGIIIYQEQVMQIVNQVAGLDWAIADKIRKVIAKSKGSDEMNYFRGMFIQGCLDNHTLDLQQATELFDDIVSFGGYGFNLAHAVEYSMITAWDMWLKVYYPLEFYCASFSNASNDDSLQRLIDDAWENKVEIRSPKIGKSLAKEWAIVNNKLYAPLTSIKGIGDKTAKKLENLGRVEEEKKVRQIGFFVKTSEIVVKQNSNGKYQAILEDIEAYTDKRMSVQWAKEKEKYFGFYFKR